MLTNWKRNVALLMLSLLLTACGTFKPPLVVEETQIPSAPQELMEPEESSGKYLESVQELFSRWRAKLNEWRSR